MKQKLQEFRAKLQIKSGSILAYTLIVLGIILAAALSIAAVTAVRQKGAGTTASSVQSFNVADSGAEVILGKIKTVGITGTLNDLGTCDGSSGAAVVAGNIGSGKEYTVTFFNTDGDQLDCAASISQVDKIKSVGQYANTARAVEVAVAADCIAGQEVVISSSNANFTASDLAELTDYVTTGNNSISGFLCRKDGVVRYVAPAALTISTSSALVFASTPTFTCTAGAKCVDTSGITLDCIYGWTFYGTCTCPTNVCGI